MSAAHEMLVSMIFYKKAAGKQDEINGSSHRFSLESVATQEELRNYRALQTAIRKALPGSGL